MVKGSVLCIQSKRDKSVLFNNFHFIFENHLSILRVCLPPIFNFGAGSLLLGFGVMKICNVKKGGLFYLSLFLSKSPFFATPKVGLFAGGSEQAPNRIRMGLLLYSKSQADACDFFINWR